MLTLIAVEVLVPLRLFAFLSVAVHRLPIWIFKKIQVHNIFIIFLCKVKDRKCLAALPAALDNQWLAIFCVFPVNQFLLNFPFQHDSFASLILFYFSIAENNNFFKGVLTQTANFFE